MNFLLRGHILHPNTICLTICSKFSKVYNLSDSRHGLYAVLTNFFQRFEGDPSYCEKCGFVWMIIRMWLHIYKLRLFEKEVLEWENESLICTLLKPARHTQTLVRVFVNSWTISWFVREKLLIPWQRKNGDRWHFWHGTDSWSI